MTKLSVNVNKIATIRNARGGNIPNLTQVVKDCQNFGADGITIHPRPDERHITTKDVYEIREVIETEYNIEGYPDQRYLNLIKDIRPHQATLVPDSPHVLTSDNGWNTSENMTFLQDVCAEIKSLGIRCSIFVNPNEKDILDAAQINVDRIELYTGPYAMKFEKNKEEAIKMYVNAAKQAVALGIGVNAGHDLNLNNLLFFKRSIAQLDEVSIGHALISDALYLGLENTIQLYKKMLQQQ